MNYGKSPMDVLLFYFVYIFRSLLFESELKKKKKHSVFETEKKSFWVGNRSYGSIIQCRIWHLDKKVQANFQGKRHENHRPFVYASSHLIHVGFCGWIFSCLSLKMDRHTHRERKRRESAKENMDTRNENCVYNAVMATAAVAVSMVAASEAATVTTKATYTHAPLDSLTIAILTAVAHSCLIFFFFAITAAAAASSMFLFEIFFFSCSRFRPIVVRHICDLFVVVAAGITHSYENWMYYASKNRGQFFGNYIEQQHHPFLLHYLFSHFRKSVYRSIKEKNIFNFILCMTMLVTSLHADRI